MKKTRIIVQLLTEKEKIIKMVIKDIIKKLGDSGYISLPNELIGRNVQITLEVLK